jgi:ADP-heptose:LPS heptosyltransferase
MFISALHEINIPLRKILIIQLGDIGDVVCAIPAFRAVKAAFPQVELSVRALNNGSFQINRGFPQFFRVSHFDSGR